MSGSIRSKIYVDPRLNQLYQRRTLEAYISTSYLFGIGATLFSPTVSVLDVFFSTLRLILVYNMSMKNRRWQCNDALTEKVDCDWARTGKQARRASSVARDFNILRLISHALLNLDVRVSRLNLACQWCDIRCTADLKFETQTMRPEKQRDNLFAPEMFTRLLHNLHPLEFYHFNFLLIEFIYFVVNISSSMTAWQGTKQLLVHSDNLHSNLFITEFRYRCQLSIPELHLNYI